MWNRQLLKEEAKKVFTFNSNNYWKMVLVGLILMVLSGGIGGALGGFSGVNINLSNNNRNRYDDRTYSYNSSANRSHKDKDLSNEDIEKYLDKYADGYDEYYEYDDGKGNYYSYSRKSNDVGALDKINPFSSFTNRDWAFLGVSTAMIVLIAIFATVIGLVIGFVIKAFAINPVILGGKAFFLKSYERESDLKDLGNGFRVSYMNNVKTLFLKDLYVFLWSLLFVIPGIIKAYEYRMMPYLIAENPDMTSNEAFAKSREMMTGNKWNAFVYDLSFLGWFILNSLTCGILGIFYVAPYYYAADANLYRAIKMGGSTRFKSRVNQGMSQQVPPQGQKAPQKMPLQVPPQGQKTPQQMPQQAPSQGQAGSTTDVPTDTPTENSPEQES